MFGLNKQPVCITVYRYLHIYYIMHIRVYLFTFTMECFFSIWCLESPTCPIIRKRPCSLTTLQASGVVLSFVDVGRWTWLVGCLVGWLVVVAPRNHVYSMSPMEPINVFRWFNAGPVEKDKTEAPIMLDGPSLFGIHCVEGSTCSRFVGQTRQTVINLNWIGWKVLNSLDILFTLVFFVLDASRISGWWGCWPEPLAVRT